MEYKGFTITKTGVIKKGNVTYFKGMNLGSQTAAKNFLRGYTSHRKKR